MGKQKATPLPKLVTTPYSQQQQRTNTPVKNKVLCSSTQDNAESNSSPSKRPFPILQGDYKVDHVVEYFEGDIYTIAFINDHGLTNRSTMDEAELQSKSWEKLLEFWAFNACGQKDEVQSEKKFGGKSLSEVCLDKIQKQKLATLNKCIIPSSNASQSTFEEITPPPTSSQLPASKGSSRTRNKKRTPLNDEAENLEKDSAHSMKLRKVQPQNHEILEPTPGTSASAISQTSQPTDPATSLQENQGIVLQNELECVQPSVETSIGRVIKRSYVKDESNIELKKSYTVEWTLQTLETSESLGVDEKTLDSLMAASTQNTHLTKVLKKTKTDGMIEVATTSLSSPAHTQSSVQLQQDYDVLTISSSSDSESESESEDLSQDECDIEDSTMQLRKKTILTKKRCRRTNNAKKSVVVSTVRQEEESEEINPEPEVENQIVEVDYDVHRVRDFRFSEGVLEFYIHWKNYGSDWDTWEPFSNLDCDGKLIKFYVERAVERKRAEKDLKQKGRDSYFRNRELPPIPPLPPKILQSLGITGEIEKSELEAVWKEMGVGDKRKPENWSKQNLMVAMLDAANAWERRRSPTQTSDIKEHQNTIFLIEFKRRSDDNLKELKRWEEEMNGITKGMPQICVENNVDLAGPPTYFKYINDVIIHDDITPQVDGIFCDCDDTGKSSCSSKTECGCLALRELFLTYSKNKRLLAQSLKKRSVIYECGEDCKCGPKCLNRVVQDGVSTLAANRICIFRTTDKGWGVKTLQKIKKLSYVCLYAGEVITTDEAEIRGKQFEQQFGATYLFDLDVYIKMQQQRGQGKDLECKYTVDASRMGNFSHFINHSCDPNLRVFNVWVGRADADLPRLALFAIKDINVGEELTYDYCPRVSDGEENMSQSGMKPANSSAVTETDCLCGAAICRRRIF